MPGETMDFGALAARLAVNIEDVRACLLMSRDGLTLGVYPKEEEAMARDVWDRLRSIGNPERGFLVVRDELWIVARRGPYAGIAVASATATPGLLLDRLEFTLRAAEELRLRDGSTGPSVRSEASRRPRTPLHPEPAAETAPQPAEVRAEAAEADADLAWLAEPVELLPMVDLSEVKAAGRGQSRTEPEASPAAGEEELDPVRAAIQFATMTGAVGAIPTMRKPEAPQAPEPTTPEPEAPEPPAAPQPEPPPAAESPSSNGEARTDAPAIEASVEALEAPPVEELAVEVAPEHEEEATAVEPPVVEAPPVVEDPTREALPEEVPQAPAPDLSAAEVLAAEAELAAAAMDDEAEVDPVDLAREFAHLMSDKDEEAR